MRYDKISFNPLSSFTKREIRNPNSSPYRITSFNPLSSFTKREINDKEVTKLILSLFQSTLFIYEERNLLSMELLHTRQ